VVLDARVPTRNPKPWEFDDSLPDPEQATWAKISFTVERNGGGVVDAELIRPIDWIEYSGIKAGQRLPLNIAELQVVGLAYVTAVEPCPEIASGDGSVITGRFVTRQVDRIARIKILGADGKVETIEGTPIHPVWSEDRQDWIPLGELQEGEQLRGDTGTAIVLAATILLHPTPVYNIEVHGEHVYQVGELGVLVHNVCPAGIVELANGQIALGFMSRAGKLLVSSTNVAGGHEALALTVSGLTSLAKSGQAIAFTAAKRLDGTIDIFGSGTFQVQGGLTESMKAMIRKLVR
jgi:hypothetical protein